MNQNMKIIILRIIYMNPIYKKLMEQHGGSIPFDVLSKAHKKLNSKVSTVRKKKSRKKKSRMKTSKVSTIHKKYNPVNYPVGVIIEEKGKLWRVNPSNKWIKI